MTAKVSVQTHQLHHGLTCISYLGATLCCEQDVLGPAGASMPLVRQAVTQRAQAGTPTSLPVLLHADGCVTLQLADLAGLAFVNAQAQAFT